MGRLTILGLMIAGMLSTWSCETKRESLGAENEIVVISSETDKDVITGFLRSIFHDTIYTPQPEPYYQIRHVSPDGFTDIKRQTLLVIGSIGDDLINPGTRLVRDLLGVKQFRQTLDGDHQIIFTRDQFAQHQLFMILSARTEDELADALEGKEDGIKSSFDNLFRERQSRFLFERSRRTKLEERFLNEYNWSLKIPWGWELIRDSTNANFVWLGREMPYQWIGIHWDNGLTVENRKEAETKSRKFAASLYQSIRFTDYNLKVEQVDFQHWTAWKIAGLWEHIEEAQGGPFLHYIFYDGVSDRTYQINGLIFYPGSSKGMMLRQIDLIAHNFSIPEG